MKTVTIEFNKATDFHIFEHLFRQFKVKVLNAKEKEVKTSIQKKKKDLPIETATPNEETIASFNECDLLVEQYKRGLIKGYTDVKQMFADIDNE